MKELYKKVYIKGEADLPKGDDLMICKLTDDWDDNIRLRFASTIRINWEKIDWYLQPIELPSEEEINKLMDEYIMTKLCSSNEEIAWRKSILKFYNWLLNKLKQ